MLSPLLKSFTTIQTKISLVTAFMIILSMQTFMLLNYR